MLAAVLSYNLWRSRGIGDSWPLAALQDISEPALSATASLPYVGLFLTEAAT